MKTRKLKNKVLSILVVMVMLLGMLPATVLAAEPDVVKSYHVATLYADGTLEITDDVSNLASIPWQNERSLIKKVVFTVDTQLYTRLFSDCTNLEEITLPNSITEIPQRCFNNCTSLTNITIPDSVTAIGERAFSDCERLSSIVFGENSQLKTIGAFAFNDCDVLESVVIPDGVTLIDEHAFNSCDALMNIVIPDSVSEIRFAAFSSCRSLASISIPSTITSIPDRTFHACSALTSITIPDSVTSIGEMAFYNCDALASVIIPASVISIDQHAFYSCDVLMDIYYTGTPAQWEGISMGDSAIPSGVTVHTMPELTIAGISDGDSFPIGANIPFTAIGKGMDNDIPVECDYQYRPYYWKVLDPSDAVVDSGDWVEDNTIEENEAYNASIDTDAMRSGQYTLIVACFEWQWQSGVWTPTGMINPDEPGNAHSTISITFELYCNEHSGGTATCTEKAICSVCGQPYGEVLGHDWGDWISNGDGTHTRTCANDANHTETNDCSGGTATCTEKAKCIVCATEYGNTLPHSYGTEWKSDDTNHWNECACGEKAEVAAHSGGTASCKDKAVCSVCGVAYGELAAHTYVNGECRVCEAADPNYQPPATDSPQTGDDINMWLWIALLIASGAVITPTVVCRNKRIVDR